MVLLIQFQVHFRVSYMTYERKKVLDLQQEEKFFKFHFFVNPLINDDPSAECYNS
jgi:hypothetical protein